MYFKYLHPHGNASDPDKTLSSDKIREYDTIHTAFSYLDHYVLNNNASCICSECAAGMHGIHLILQWDCMYLGEEHQMYAHL